MLGGKGEAAEVREQGRVDTIERVHSFTMTAPIGSQKVNFRYPV